jgi:hypothetical protein
VRPAVMGVMLMLVVIGLTGCLSIKSQGLSQLRVPGLVTLGGVVCGSDYNRTTYADCDGDGADGTGPANVAEADNRPNSGCDADGSQTDANAGCPGLAGDGQLMVGFRVPIGSDGPPTFASDARDLIFEKSPSYTQRLEESFRAPAGEHWVGYVSTVRTFQTGAAADSPTGIHPEFSLPAPSDGAPFTGAYHWRWVVGFRKVAKEQAGSDVSCSGFGAFCVDSPPQAQVPNDLPASAVSDFGVLAGNRVVAAQGTTATVAFPVRYVDAAVPALGTQQFSITATTGVPGSTAAPTSTTLRATPNSTPTANVRVPIPATTPLGSYTVTLSAKTGAPAVERSNRATIVVADQQAPRIRIGTPAVGATFVRRQRVRADYECTDQVNASGVRSCAGPVAPGALIDTRSVGTKTFTVNATDNAGNTATESRTYAVGPSPAPLISLSSGFAAGARTTFTTLLVRGVPRGATVTAICHPAKRAKCPVKKRFKKRSRRGGSVSIKSFLRKPFRPRTKIEVRVTSPGTIGAVRVITIRRNKGPAPAAIRCLPPGAKKPTRCR